MRLELTKEQQTLFNRNKRKAREYFGILGNNDLVLHHKDETLRYNDVDRYIQWNIEDLEVMTRGEHSTLHHKGKKHNVDLRGEKNPNYGKRHPGLNKGDPRLGAQTIGKHWYNNGTDNILAYECPEGYVKGRLVSQAVLDNLKLQSELNKERKKGNTYGKLSHGNLGRTRKYRDDGSYYYKEV